MDAVFEACRWLNQYLGIIGCICVLWRLVPLVLDLIRDREVDVARLHRILVFAVLATFEILNAVAAARGTNGPLPAVWTSLGFTIAHTSTIVLCIWWPHPRRIAPTSS
jgi:hypothetical protein